jgi:hypothetical protein
VQPDNEVKVLDVSPTQTATACVQAYGIPVYLQAGDCQTNTSSY